MKLKRNSIYSRKELTEAYRRGKINTVKIFFLEPSFYDAISSIINKKYGYLSIFSKKLNGYYVIYVVEDEKDKNLPLFVIHYHILGLRKFIITYIKILLHKFSEILNISKYTDKPIEKYVNYLFRLKFPKI